MTGTSELADQKHRVFSVWRLRWCWLSGFFCAVIRVAGVIVVLLVCGVFTRFFSSARILIWFWKLAGFFYSLWFRLCGGIRYELRGMEKIPQDTPVLFAVQHQSAWETFVLPPFLIPKQVPAPVLKRSLFFLPLVYTFIDESNAFGVNRFPKRSAQLKETKRLLAHLKKVVENGQSVLIYPQGTRQAVGADIDCKGVVRVLYKELGLPCVPIALNAGLFIPPKTCSLFPGKILVEVQDLIPPGLPSKVFEQKLTDSLQEAGDRLILETAQETRRFWPILAKALALVEERKSREKNVEAGTA